MRKFRCRRRGLTLLELFVVLAIILGMLALLLPALQTSRRQAINLVCQSKLAQFRVGWRQLQQNNPRAIATATGPKATVSWRVLLLPYLEQQDLFNEYHPDRPWNAPVNAVLRNALVPMFRCPAAPDLALGHASYDAPALNLQAAIPTDRGPTPELLVVEVSGPLASPWTRPTYDPALKALERQGDYQTAFGGNHDNGFHRLGPGSVVFVPLPLEHGRELADEFGNSPPP